MNNQSSVRFFGFLLTGFALLLFLCSRILTSSTLAQQLAVKSSPRAMQVPVATTIPVTQTELERQKLVEEVAKLRTENQRTWFTWFENNIAVIVTALGVLFAYHRWNVDRESERKKRYEDRRDEREKRYEDRRNERQKQAEERFQSIVEGLASTSQMVKTGAAITLRTFLRPGYEQFYLQVFNLAVVHLQIEPSKQRKPNTSTFASPSVQAIASVFIEAFPRVRDTRTTLSTLESVYHQKAINEAKSQLNPSFPFVASLESSLAETSSKHNFDSVLHRDNVLLSAAYVHLEDTILYGADLKTIKMQKAKLCGADLRRVHLTNADLTDADLTGADLTVASLCKARLNNANLNRVHIFQTDFTDADLTRADLTDARVVTNLISGEQLLSTRSVEGAVISVEGLTPEERTKLRNKGATIM